MEFTSARLPLNFCFQTIVEWMPPKCKKLYHPSLLGEIKQLCVLGQSFGHQIHRMQEGKFSSIENIHMMIASPALLQHMLHISRPLFTFLLYQHQKSRGLFGLQGTHLEKQIRVNGRKIGTCSDYHNPKLGYQNHESCQLSHLFSTVNRIIHNQPEVIQYLKEQREKKGIELIVADFHGEKKHTSFEEQAHIVSRTNIMIGIHGAGLNMFMFLPFNSVVVEVHVSQTEKQKNSKNTVTHLGTGKYLQEAARKKGGNLIIPPVWDTLKRAIDIWYDLNGGGNKKIVSTNN